MSNEFVLKAQDTTGDEEVEDSNGRFASRGSDLPPVVISNAPIRP